MTAKHPILRRYVAAKQRRDLWDSILQETYAMVLPDLDAGQARTEGAKNDIELYEGQGARSLAKRTARMSGQLYPPLSDRLVSFEFQGQPLEKLPPQFRDAAADYLNSVADVVHAAITESNFFIEQPQSFKDVLVSTGAMMVNPGDPDLGPPLVFEAIPIGQLVPEEGPFGTIETVFIPREIRRRDVEARWPAANTDGIKDWAKKRDEDPDGKVKVVEAQVFNPKERTYTYQVILEDGEHELVIETMKTKPIIVFRMDKATGEVMGRGPAMTCRADLRTANKVKELILANASIAVSGMWQADDDGVLNPANIALQPGIIIPKAAGSAGLQPLESPSRFDVSQIVLNDLLKSIKETIEGSEMPGYDTDRPVAQAYLTAQADRADVEVPQHTRLFYELDAPLWRRVIAILSSDMFKGSVWYIPPAFEGKDKQQVKRLELKPTPVNPLAAIQKQAQWQRLAGSVAGAMQLFGPQMVAAEVKLTDLLRDYLTQSGGLDQSYLVTAAEKQQQAQAQAQAQQAQLAAAAQGLQAGAEMASTETGTQMLRDVGQMMGGANAA